MTTANFIQTSLELIAVAILVLCFYYEDRLAAFERKAFKYIRAFFIACFILIKQKYFSKKSAEIVEIKNRKTDSFENAKTRKAVMHNTDSAVHSRTA